MKWGSCLFIHLYYRSVGITIFPTSPPPPTGWTNWPINERENSNLIWPQFFPYDDIHVYFYIHSFWFQNEGIGQCKIILLPLSRKFFTVILSTKSRTKISFKLNLKGRRRKSLKKILTSKNEGWGEEEWVRKPLKKR